MLNQQQSIAELMSGIETEFRKRGQSFHTQLFNLKCCQVIVNLHEIQGLEYLDCELVAEHIRQLHERFANGDLGSSFYYGQLRNIRSMLEYNETGTISWSSPTQGSKYKLNTEFERIANAYLPSVEMHPNTRNDARWVAYKYFAWLAEQGHEDLSGVGITTIQQFLVHCSKNMSPTSMHDIKLYMKKLYDYLATAGMTDIPYKALLSFKVNRESKIYPCVPKEDIAAILNAVDRKTRRGKRDYAILLLGTVLGLRAIDIVNLKLNDIDWVHGEIKLSQAKTGENVVLPLTRDVGEALQDYILKARPKSAVKNIFLRINTPHKEFRSAVTIADIYNDWRKVAGLAYSRSFHSLRRTLGRDMVTTGTPVTTVAQVLGHSEINSTQKYISLDSRHLKLCALPFDGIAPIGGDVR